MVIFHSYVSLPEGIPLSFQSLFSNLGSRGPGTSQVHELLHAHSPATLNEGVLTGDRTVSMAHFQGFVQCLEWIMSHMGMGQNPGTPVVHIKIAGIYGCSSH